jgi:hypothetical protein
LVKLDVPIARFTHNETEKQLKLAMLIFGNVRYCDKFLLKIIDCEFATYPVVNVGLPEVLDVEIPVVSAVPVT